MMTIEVLRTIVIPADSITTMLYNAKCSMEGAFEESELPR